MSIDLTNITEAVASEWWEGSQDEPWADLSPSTKVAVKSALLPIINRVAESVEAVVRAEIHAKIALLPPSGSFGDLDPQDVFKAVE